MPTFSVIVPIYNAEKYLKKCLDSIIAQTFSDFELILINDGSTDKSLKICEELSERDLRVIVINQSNGGASSARNHGIEVAKGIYICFVDADDFVSEHYLEQLYQDQCVDKDVDLVMHGMYRIIGNKLNRISFDRTRTYNLIETNSFFKDVKLFKFCGPCSKSFHHDIITNHKIRFNQGVVFSEDFDFFAKYLFHCKKIRVSDTQNYYYVFRDNTVSTRINSFEKERSSIYYLFNSLSELNNRFQDFSLDSQIKDYLSYYMSRVLTSVYEPPRPDYSVRLENLKSIDDTFVRIYRDFFVPPTFYGKVLKCLFVSGLYRLYDVGSLMWRRKVEGRI